MGVIVTVIKPPSRTSFVLPTTEARPQRATANQEKRSVDGVEPVRPRPTGIDTPGVLPRESTGDIFAMTPSARRIFWAALTYNQRAEIFRNAPPNMRRELLDIGSHTESMLMYEALFTSMPAAEFREWWGNAPAEFVASNFPFFSAESRANLFDKMTAEQRHALQTSDIWTPELAAPTFEAWLTGMNRGEFSRVWDQLPADFIASNWPRFSPESQAHLFDMMSSEQRHNLCDSDFFTPERAIAMYEAYFADVTPGQFQDAWSQASPQFIASNFPHFSEAVQLMLVGQMSQEQAEALEAVDGSRPWGAIRAHVETICGDPSAFLAIPPELRTDVFRSLPLEAQVAVYRTAGEHIGPVIGACTREELSELFTALFFRDGSEPDVERWREGGAGLQALVWPNLSAADKQTLWSAMTGSEQAALVVEIAERCDPKVLLETVRQLPATSVTALFERGGTELGIALRAWPAEALVRLAESLPQTAWPSLQRALPPDVCVRMVAEERMHGPLTDQLANEILGTLASAELGKLYCLAGPELRERLESGQLAWAMRIANVRPATRLLQEMSRLPLEQQGIAFALLPPDLRQAVFLNSPPGSQSILLSHLPVAERAELMRNVPERQFDFTIGSLEPPSRWLEQGQQTEVPESVQRVVDAIPTGATDLETLQNIMDYVLSLASPERGRFSGCKSARDLVNGESLDGCSDFATLFATLARAKGIPTTCLNTIKAAWAVDERAAQASGGHVPSAEGHAFVECYIDDHWVLIDSTAGTILDPYDPTNPVVPGPPGGSTAYVVVGRHLDDRAAGVWTYEDLSAHARQAAAEAVTDELLAAALGMELPPVLPLHSDDLGDRARDEDSRYQ